MNIHTLTLKARDLTQLFNFYSGLLGLPVQLSPPELSVQIGAAQMIFKHDDKFSGFYHLAFDIPPHQMEEAQAWLEQRTSLLTDPHGSSRFEPSRQWNTTSLYFPDAAGNILELIGRHHLPIETAGPFAAGSLHHVSELGVVVPDVPATVQQLGARFSLFPFNGSSETFTPVGGHDGMLIVVQEGRGWFPVARPAVSAPFVLEFSGAGGRQRINQDDLRGHGSYGFRSIPEHP
jgi:catechol 2,3-dioxygenase-like lactoylglutathione lyase family enzyme